MTLIEFGWILFAVSVAAIVVGKVVRRWTGLPRWKRRRQFHRGEVDRWILSGTLISVVQWNKHGLSAVYRPNEYDNDEQLGGDHDSVTAAMKSAERYARAA